ncbi:MAG: hypothetical protein U0572_04930 [Phycisphaerales bacterium]
MQPDTGDAAFLLDMVRACDLIATFIRGETIEDYRSDEFLRSSDRSRLSVGEAPPEQVVTTWSHWPTNREAAFVPRPEAHVSPVCPDRTPATFKEIRDDGDVRSAAQTPVASDDAFNL